MYATVTRAGILVFNGKFGGCLKTEDGRAEVVVVRRYAGCTLRKLTYLTLGAARREMAGSAVQQSSF
jgi:hypothetical protein